MILNTLFSQQRLILILKAVSESRITKNKLSPIDISIPNYSYKFCPTKANAGGTLIYIRNHLSYKTRNDLKIYKSFELESTFIEICNLKKTNIIIGSIYKHPNMNINKFNDNYLNELLDKSSQENKLYFFYISSSRVTTNSKTLIGNIFSNMAVPNIISGYLTASISDHLPQILVAPNAFFNASYPTSNNYERDWSRFDQENLLLDYFSVEWDNFLLSSNANTKKSYTIFLEKFEFLVDTDASLKKLLK